MMGFWKVLMLAEMLAVEMVDSMVGLSVYSMADDLAVMMAALTGKMTAAPMVYLMAS